MLNVKGPYSEGKGHGKPQKLGCAQFVTNIMILKVTDEEKSNWIQHVLLYCQC
jgi:hypothetical protein